MTCSLFQLNRSELLIRLRRITQVRLNNVKAFCEFLLGILGAHSTLLLEVTLVANQHDDNVLVGMATELIQPTRNVVKALAFGDIID